MEENDPRRKLDRFTGALCEKLRGEIQSMAYALMSADKDVANAQIDVLEKSALHRVKDFDFNFDMWLLEIGADDMPEDEIVQIAHILLAALEQTFRELREIIVDRDEALFRDPGEDELPE